MTMNAITEKPVQMSADDWRLAAKEAIEHAVGWLHNDGIINRAGALARSAEMIRAADTFNGRANLLDMSDAEDAADRTTVEVLATDDDEEEPEPAWPSISAKLHQVADHNPKFLPMVEQIDKLFALAVEKGLPQPTLADFEAELEPDQRPK